MRVRTHIKAGEFTAVSAAHSSANGRGQAVPTLNGAALPSSTELRDFWRLEVRPWLIFGGGRLRGATTGSERGMTSYSFEAADPAMQTIARRWIDPLFGQRGDQQLHDLGLAVDLDAIQPQEKNINRNMVIALGTFGMVLAGTTVAPVLLPLGATLTLLMVLNPASIAYDAWVKRRKLTAAATATLSVLGAWLGGYYMASAVGGVLFCASEKLLYLSQNRARQGLVSVFGQQPRSAWVLVNGVEIETPFDQVQAGDTVVVHAGQTIPVDGTIVKGVASIDQHMLTGEAQPVERGVGDAVLATTVVLTGSIHVAVEKAGQATAAAEIAHLFSQVDSYQLSVQAKAVDFGDQVVIPTLLASGLAVPVLGVPAAVALLRLPLAASLKMTAPIAMLNYLHVLAHQGVLVKDGRSLELLAQVDTIVFDKTGTLTLEQPHVAKVHVVDGFAEDEVLRLAATAEQRQSHPIARAIMMAAGEHGLSPRSIDDAHYEVGFGIQVRVEDKVIRVGSSRFMDMEGIAVPPALRQVQALCAAQSHSVVLVSVDEAVVGALELHATLRPEAKALMERLRAQGLEVHILSGDQEAPTQRLAHELEVDHYWANVLPEGKAKVIEQLQAQGRSVCFVGDGINDAIALKTAHVSVSLRGATTVAMDAAQIVLMEQSLDQFGRLLDIAAELEATQQRSFSLTRGMRVALAGGVLVFAYDIYWSLVIIAANTVAGLVNAATPLRKYKLALPDRHSATVQGETHA